MRHTIVQNARAILDLALIALGTPCIDVVLEKSSITSFSAITMSASPSRTKEIRQKHPYPSSSEIQKISRCSWNLAGV